MITTRQFILRSQIPRYCANAIATTTSEILVGTPCFNIISPSCKQNNCRHMATKPSAGSDPLDLLRQRCTSKKHCDDEGRRLKTTEHWTLSIAIASSDPKMAPNLRTIGIERITPAGIDFVMKSTSPASISAVAGLPVSIKYQEGKFLPGQSAEQWRGEGHCEKIPLAEIVDLIPLYTATSMIASCRINDIAQEHAKADVSQGRMAMISKSRTTEVMQTTRNGLENKTIPMEEMEKCITAFRFIPQRLEYMHGGPDTVMWDRWEWMRKKDSSNGWADPINLIPH